MGLGLGLEADETAIDLTEAPVELVHMHVVGRRCLAEEPAHARLELGAALAQPLHHEAHDLLLGSGQLQIDLPRAVGAGGHGA